MNTDVRIGRRAARFALAALSICLALPGAAGASTASVASGVLTYAGGDTIDYAWVAYSEGYYWVNETSSTPLSAGPGCSADDGKVRCSALSVSSLRMDLGGGDDQATNFTLLPAVINGGAGADKLYGGGVSDRIDGGGGADLIDGGWGDDVLVGGDGADLIQGNSGIDHADYSSRTAPVTVTVDIGADDGADGEGDEVRGVEVVTGGSGNDTLAGSSVGQYLDGGMGNDTLTGGIGDDTLEGGPGADSFDGGPGADALLAADGEVDTGSCGDGADTFSADSADVLDATCEGWTAGVTVGSGGEPHVTTVIDSGGGGGGGGGASAGLPATVFQAPLAVNFGTKPAPFDVARGTVSLALSCAADCTGKVTLAIGPRAARVGTARRRSTRGRKPVAIGRRRFKLAAGKEAKVPVRLSRRGRRALSVRRRTKVQATVTMNTPAGKRYDTRTIVVERRVARKARAKKPRKSGGRGRRR